MDKSEARGNIGKPIIVFLMLSLVSFFADFTYEGARSVSGPYLSELGATLVIAGSLSIGEAISYLARLLSGLLSFRFASPRFYWGMVFLGYSINLIAVPLLALAGNWEIAFILYLFERLGKGLRAPTRDAILSEVGASLGMGKLFGIHEVLDQGGAIIGALFMAYASGKFGLATSFVLLGIPAMIALLLLASSYLLYPRPHVAAKPRRDFGPVMLHSLRIAIPLMLFIIPFVHWVTAGYLLTANKSVADIALLYAVAMAIDAVAAIPLGLLYDKMGRNSIIILPIMSIIATFSMFSAQPIIFAILWGISMAGYETIAKAYIASSTLPEERGVAYGVAYALMGLGWTVGNIAIALLV